MIHIDRLQFRPAGITDRTAGVRGYITCVVDHRWRAELTLRRTLRETWRVAFLATVGRNGRRRYGMAPVDDVVRREVEGAVLAALPDEAFLPEGRDGCSLGRERAAP